MEDTVNVAIRVRPSSNLFEKSIAVSVVNDNPPVLHVTNKQLYSFDNIFSENTSQEKVYDAMVKPLVKKVLQGYNCTVFAYGQTGTGKTYTIGSNPKSGSEAGFIARACDGLFGNREDYKDLAVSITFYEIYNEKLFDLLSPKRGPVSVKGFKVDGLETVRVHNRKEAGDLLAFGSLNRHTGETKQNRFSSRSHAVFTLTCVVRNENHETEAKLNLVDLAGSESVRRTGTAGSQFQEGININKGLFYIGRVINALTTNVAHIPYRQSMLTTILQDSLSKRNFITLVACVSPDLQDAQETIQTLEFAQGTKRVKNKPEVNNAILEYKKKNAALFERPAPLSAVKVRPTPLKRQNQSMNCPSTPSFAKTPKVNHSWTPGVQTPPTLATLSVASSLRDGPIVLSSFSPIVQKCTEAVEHNIMKKFPLLVQSCARRRSSEIDEQQFSWRSLHAEVSQIVRDEFVQLTAQRSRACSSPLQSANVAKRLEFDDEDDAFVFKVPTKPPPKIVQQKARRSARLSKRVSPPPPPTQAPTRRRSARLTTKHQTEVAPKPTPRRSVAKRSPVPTPRKAPLARDAKQHAHHAHILDILNRGSEKELQKLPSVGPKTASQIYLYRQLHGPLDDIKDLEKMQSWIGNQYKRFLRSNLLDFDE